MDKLENGQKTGAVSGSRDCFISTSSRQFRFNGLADFINGVRLLNKTTRPHPHGSGHIFCFGISADNNGSLPGNHFQDPFVCLAAVYAMGKNHVKQNQVERLRLNAGDGLIAALNRHGRISQGVQNLAQQFPLKRFIVHHQNALSAASACINGLAPIFFLRALGYGEKAFKTGPLFTADDVDLPLVIPDDVPYNRQPQPRPALPHDLR